MYDRFMAIFASLVFIGLVIAGSVQLFHGYFFIAILNLFFSLIVGEVALRRGRLALQSIRHNKGASQ